MKMSSMAFAHGLLPEWLFYILLHLLQFLFHLTHNPLSRRFLGLWLFWLTEVASL
jgi:hypothetical protein